MDFSLEKSITTVYLAQGFGPLNLTNAENLEYTKISFMEGKNNFIYLFEFFKN